MARIGRELIQVSHKLEVSFLILDKIVVVRKAHRIKHLEAVELRFRMQLQRRTRQKQHALRTRNHSVRKHVLVARETILAHQMVGFIDDGHVPVRLQEVFDQRRLRHQEIKRYDNIVTLQERVRLRFVFSHAHKQTTDVAFIHQRKELVKTALHFNHPLVFERFRNNHERTLNSAPRLEGMPNHTRFNRLSKPHFVRKHKPWECRARAGAVAKVILVRDHVHARANHATDWRRCPLVIHLHRIFMTQKIARRANFVIGQSLEQHSRSSRRKFRTQLGFLHFLAVSPDINHDSRIFANGLHHKRDSLFALDSLTHLQHKTFNRSFFGSVNSSLTDRREQNLDSTSLDFRNNTKSQGGLGLANVTLTNFKHHHNL